MVTKRYTLRPFRDIPHYLDKEWQYFAPSADQAIAMLWKDRIKYFVDNRLEAWLDVGMTDQQILDAGSTGVAEWQIANAYWCQCGCNTSEIVGATGAYFLLTEPEMVFFNAGFSFLYGYQALDEFTELALDRIK